MILINLYNKDKLLFFLTFILFNSIYFGNLIIHISILSVFIYSVFFIKEIKLDYTEKILIFFSLYLIISSLNKSGYLINSIFFLKYAILFLSVKFIILKINKKTFHNVIFSSTILLLFLIIDLFYQKTTGLDIFGFESLAGGRLTGPFKDEMIPGSVLLYIGFYFVFFYYYKLINSENYFNSFLSFFLLSGFIVAILITGERINFISSILLLSIIFFLIKSKSKHFIFTILIIFLSIFIIFKDDYLNSRYSSFLSTLNPSLDTKVFNQDEIDDYKKEIDILKNKEKKETGKNNLVSEMINKVNFFDTTWGAHYLTAFEMFKKKPLFGHGIKSFRDKCSQQIINSVNKSKRCSTHPHNLHLEILSETGIIGYLIFLTLILSIFVKSLKIIINEKLYDKDTNFILFIATFSLLLILIFPIKSSGRFFSTSFGFYFWLNLSLLNASIRNILRKKSNKI